ncbi:hypothetical protein D307_gp163 [Bacillus phage Bastille]|uniref:Uncharacterized protein n=5 Tax=Bastillevirus TaxID=1918010 RepID=J9PM88_9CAUD|nr:hypothetical protein D307_gp163 [Bacillus phage Bastille]YP_009035362.1 hypothetical protein FP73_gp176 [Bacillus phage Hoody T]YP_009037071.1 hypothetical protein FP74_gp191 [Bacillus phage CAM003]AMW61923.1 hypothetical protein DNAM5_179 [Bacillus phage Vinny]ASU01021.1 hypothetical protein ANTHONY_181 [Bacillus phage Anthony]AEQ34301.1 hypothetical protein [Bacillus phage Bastille]AHZ09605.1 hypothetical protein [Bacillus phage CAM003]AHZ10477.1 hypothetical protein [Bacillus phage Hoo
MEAGVKYEVNGFEYMWSLICYMYSPVGEEKWAVIPTDSYHMEIIKDLEGMNIEN